MSNNVIVNQLEINKILNGNTSTLQRRNSTTPIVLLETLPSDLNIIKTNNSTTNISSLRSNANNEPTSTTIVTRSCNSSNNSDIIGCNGNSTPATPTKNSPNKLSFSAEANGNNSPTTSSAAAVNFGQQLGDIGDGGGGSGGSSPGHTHSSRSHLYPHSHSSSTFSINKNEEFHFIKPQECPVFKPNEDEFKNPLAYISKIRPFAEKYGIAKIQPPKSWTPPFTVDVDKLKFTPRVQRLNELEAKTRVKLNFLDQIAKFWELQGSSLKIPMVERKALDLYSLHRIVQEEGGLEQTTRERKWSKVALRMCYPPGKSIGAILKGHYERILHPFDIFTSGSDKAIDIKLETESDDQDYKPHGIVSRQQISPPNEQTARRSKRFANTTAPKESVCGLSPSSALTSNIITTASTTCTTAPAMTTTVCGVTALSIKHEDEGKEDKCINVEFTKRLNYGKMASGGHCGRLQQRSRMSAFNMPQKKKHKEIDPLAKYICHICNRGDAEEAMLLCDGCDDSYHTFCLIPPLNEIPKGDWRCPKCVVEEVSKPTEAFGFEQAQREYTLQQFGEMADQFKADYFNMSVHLVPTDLVEREFWRIVSSIDEDVTVEYGADLHTMDHGSGFPTKSSLYLLPGDQEYAESNWNLNNLPVLEESILGHINADISGMKVPWMYVGMCFAAFCWHNEDHWSYSINYLHWGEPKTWYGVPGSKAEAFEETMKSAAPELFQSQPDLLHQLVTIMNPNILMNNGVPVYRTDQHAGEFIITFPRAYHAGFNQGYNFAEAVNFAPADWMKMGRECINHYSMLRRFCVFSHDELVCKMALEPDKLNLGIATACYLDMAEMVDSEKKLRKSLLEWGVTKAEREAFELIQDDERQCYSCKTTCFLSAVTCSCTKSIVCLRHYTELCDCLPEKHTLKYRYTLDELPLMLKKLKVKAESFENWLSKVRDVLDPTTSTTITLDELQMLAQEADSKKFPSSVLLERLNSAVLEAEKCVTVIQQLDINKMRTRTRNSADSAKYKLSMDELDMFVQEIDNLCCIIQEGQSVRELQKLGHEFVAAATKILQQKLQKCSERECEQLIEEGQLLCIELQEVKLLKSRLQQINWYCRVREFRDTDEKIPLLDIQKFLKEGNNIAPDANIEKELVELHEIKLAVEDWEEVAKKCFESGTQHELPEIELLLERADDIEGELPSEMALRDAVRKAKEWLRTVEVLQSNENYPYFHTLEAVVQRGKNIPFQLEELKRMEEHLDSARTWKEKTRKTFLKKQSQFHLMDVLAPRCSAIMVDSRSLKRKSLEEQFTEEMGPVQMVSTFKLAEEKEMHDMRQLRQLNTKKSPAEDKYCICRRNFSGLMYQCQLCRDWFHAECVPPPKQTVRPRPSGQQPSAPSSPVVPQLNCREKDRETKYLCSSCMRSRRPRLETILSLLVSLQRLPIRLPEGEALQCLTERAMNWQDRARQAFATEDVAAALAALSLISQKNGGNSTEKRTKSKMKRKKSENTASSSSSNKNSDDDDETSSDDEITSAMKIVDSDIEISSPASPTKIEHAYSALVSSGQKKITSGISSPLHKSDMPLIQLSQKIRDTLDELMMEGDLLEVSLDETLHLWRIINAAKPSISDLAFIHHRYNISSTPSDVLVISNNIITTASVGNGQSKKRRSNEHTTPIPTKKQTKNSNVSLPGQKLKRGRKIKLANSSINDSTSSNYNNISLPVDDSDRITSATEIGPSVSTSSTTTAPETGKKRKRATAANRKSIAAAQQEQLHILATAASTSDDDEECSAPNCARPSGREVDWVQCDGGCNKWFHMFCVGLDKNQIKPDDDYICKRCCKKSTSSTKTTNNKFVDDAKTIISKLSDDITTTNKLDSGGGDSENPNTKLTKTTDRDSNKSPNIS